MSTRIEVPTVRRVVTRTGTHVEPPLDPKWSNNEKLAWHAGVVVMVKDSYSIGFGSSSMGSLNYHEAWTYLNGIETGVQECRKLHGDNVFDANVW